MTHTTSTLPPLPAAHNGYRRVEYYTADQMRAYAHAALAQSAQAPAPLLFNGLTEAETNATASVAGLSPAPAQPAPSVEAVMGYAEAYGDAREWRNEGTADMRLAALRAAVEALARGAR